MKCCNKDCNQGRECPDQDNAMSVVDVAFTVVMLILSSVVTLAIMWWLITAVMMLVEVLK